MGNHDDYEYTSGSTPWYRKDTTIQSSIPASKPPTTGAVSLSGSTSQTYQFQQDGSWVYPAASMPTWYPNYTGTATPTYGFTYDSTAAREAIVNSVWRNACPYLKLVDMDTYVGDIARAMISQISDQPAFSYSTPAPRMCDLIHGLEKIAAASKFEKLAEELRAMSTAYDLASKAAADEKDNNDTGCYGCCGTP